MRILEITLPIFVFLTLLGVKGYSMETSKGLTFLDEKHTHIIDKNILMVPEIIIENFDIKAELSLKPCFDSIWNASGYEQSLNYNQDNEWKPYEK